MSGRFEIWKVGLDLDVEPSQFTDFGAFAVRFGSDGTPYVLPSGRAELLRRDPNGDWQTVLSDFHPRKAFAWTVRGEVVHALHLATDGALVWLRWHLNGDPVEGLARVPPRLENGGFAVHPDGLSAVFGRLLPMESDLRMMTLLRPAS